MARIRTIKPEFTESESIGRLSRESRLLFVLLWTFVDDVGRARASSQLLASRLYPYDVDAPKLISRWLEELEGAGHIRRYEVDGSQYLDIPKWLKHQKIDHASNSRLPECPEDFARPREEPRDIRASYHGPRTIGPRTIGPRTVTSATDGEAERAFALFNDAAKRTGWPQVQKIDAKRRKHMQERLKDVGMDGFALAIAKAEASDFLTLKWPLKIDWLLLPANFTKVIEGNYANPPPVESHEDRRDREIREAIERSKLQ